MGEQGERRRDFEAPPDARLSSAVPHRPRRWKPCLPEIDSRAEIRPDLTLPTEPAVLRAKTCVAGKPALTGSRSAPTECGQPPPAGGDVRGRLFATAGLKTAHSGRTWTSYGSVDAVKIASQFAATVGISDLSLTFFIA